MHSWVVEAFSEHYLTQEHNLQFALVKMITLSGVSSCNYNHFGKLADCQMVKNRAKKLHFSQL